MPAGKQFPVLVEKILLPRSIPRNLEGAEIFLSLEPRDSDILRVAIVPKGLRFSPADAKPKVFVPVYWLA